MSRQVALVTFATKPFYHLQASLIRSSAIAGVTKQAAWTEVGLAATEFYRQHSDIFAQPRGFGCWLWKPYLILRELESLENGDFLVYYDVGRPILPNRFVRPLQPLLAWCERQNGGMLPGVYIPEHGPNYLWTKRECFVLMNCDQPHFWHHPQIQATYSVWQKTPEARALATEWLDWCTTPGVLTDRRSLPEVQNLHGFIDHRHDQSVLTNLVIERGLKCFGRPDVTLPGSKDINNLVDRIANRELSLRVRAIRRATSRFARIGLFAAKRALARRVIFRC